MEVQCIYCFGLSLFGRMIKNKHVFKLILHNNRISVITVNVITLLLCPKHSNLIAKQPRRERTNVVPSVSADCVAEAHPFPVWAPAQPHVERSAIHRRLMESSVPAAFVSYHLTTIRPFSSFTQINCSSVP